MQLHLLIIPQKLPVKIYGKRNLIQRDVLVFAVDGCVLLAVDVDEGKADHGIGKRREPSCIGTGRQDKGRSRSGGKLPIFTIKFFAAPKMPS